LTNINLEVTNGYNEILELNNSVRFVGIANDMGTVVASAYRNGLNRLLTPEESQRLAIESVLRMITQIEALILNLLQG